MSTAGIIDSMKQTIERLTKAQIALERVVEAQACEIERLAGLHKRQGCQINALQAQAADMEGTRIIAHTALSRQRNLERVVEAQAAQLDTAMRRLEGVVAADADSKMSQDDVREVEAETEEPQIAPCFHPEVGCYHPVEEMEWRRSSALADDIRCYGCGKQDFVGYRHCPCDECDWCLSCLTDKDHGTAVAYRLK